MKRFTVMVPFELYKSFKKKCVDEEKTMVDVIAEIIRKWVETND